MGVDVKGLRVGGSQNRDIYNPTVWIRDLGNAPQDWKDPGRVSIQSGLPANKYYVKEGNDRQVGLPTSGRGDIGSVDVGGGDVNPSSLECLRSIYCNSADTGAMYDRGEKSRRVGDNKMMGSGRPLIKKEGYRNRG